jgi:hypothetical protein
MDLHKINQIKSILIGKMSEDSFIQKETKAAEHTDVQRL